MTAVAAKHILLIYHIVFTVPLLRAQNTSSCQLRTLLGLRNSYKLQLLHLLTTELKKIFIAHTAKANLIDRSLRWDPGT